MEIWDTPVTHPLPFWDFDLNVDPLHARPFKRAREPWEDDLTQNRATKYRRVEQVPIFHMEFDLDELIAPAADVPELPMELLLDPLISGSDSQNPPLTAESQLKDHLNQIACAFNRPSCSSSTTDRFSEITCLLKCFNQFYHPQSKLMHDLDACAHHFVIAQVTELLSLIKEDTWIPFKVEGFCFLGLLARNDKARNIIATNSFLQLVISQLKQTSNLELFEKCCFVLGNSITSLADKDENFQEFVEQSQVLAFLLKRISQNTGSSIVQVSFFTLGNLLFSGDFENAILNASGVDIAFKALEEHIEDDTLLVDILVFLKNMACGVKGSTVIVSHPSLLIITTIMQRYSTNEQLCQLCVQLIFHLSFSGSACFEALASASAGLILGFLKTNSCDKLSREAIRTLSKLYINSNSEGKINLLKEGLVEVVKCHLALTNRRLGRQLLNQLATCTLAHQKLPTKEFPSLMELTARKLVASGNPDSLNLLCPDLSEFLSKSKQCSHCNNHYFDYFFERLDFSDIPNFSKKVPKINTFCSRKCFDETASTPKEEEFMDLN